MSKPRMPSTVCWAAVEKTLKAGSGKTEGVAAKFSLMAREEAAHKLITNREYILNDICNGARKSQPITLEEVVPWRLASDVEHGMIETARRLLGQSAGMEGSALQPARQPKGDEEKKAWENMAKIIDARLQTSSAQCPGRAPDMGEEAGSALRAVLQEVAGSFEIRRVPNQQPFEDCLACFGFAAQMGRLLNYTAPPAIKVQATTDWKQLARTLVAGGGEAEGVAAIHSLAARVEAAKKLIMNRDAVLNDICNSSRKTQHIKAVPQNLAGIVEQGMKETARRLLGKPGYQSPISSPQKSEEKQAYVDMANIIEARMQTSFDQAPYPRKADMGSEAAKALIDVLKEVSRDHI